MKNKEGKALVDILPENLSEDTVTAISNLVESKVKEKSESVEKVLHSRFMGFMAENVDRFKSLAVKELEAEDETFKAAKLFSDIKRIVAEEVMDDEIKEVLESKNTEIKTLKKLVVDLKNHIDTVEGRNVALTESVNAYNTADLSYFENEDEDEALAGKAEMISECRDDNGDLDVVEESATFEGNEFLSDEVLSATRMITEHRKKILGE